MSTVEQDVQQVVARYGLALNSRDHDALSALHAEDAQWAFALGGQVVLGPFVGREAILAFAAASASEGTQERHLLTNVVVTPEPESASSAVAYLTLITIRDATPTISATAVAHFLFRRSSDSWLIAELRIEFVNPPVRSAHAG